MVEHWYDILPAAWLIPEARWFLVLIALLLVTLGFMLGFLVGRRKK